MNRSKFILLFVALQFFSLYNSLLFAQPPKEIRLLQDLTIGADESDAFLGFWPVKIAVMSNGTIFIADPQAYSIKKFSKEGVFLGETGQQGRGPGDFDYLRSIEACFENQVCVLDSNARISVFDAETLVLNYTIPVPLPEGDRLWAPMGMKMADEGFVVWYNRTVSTSLPNSADAIRIALVDLQGNFLIQDLKTVRNNQLFVVKTPFIWRTALPFGRTSHIDTGRPNTLFYGWSENIAIEKLNLEQLTVDSVSYSHKSVKVTKDEIESVLNSFPPDTPQGQIFRKEAQIPGTYPAYDWFFADNQNRVWVAVNTEDRDNYMLCIFDHTGRLTGRSSLPKLVELQLVSNGYAYGVRKNKEGETTAVRFEVSGF